MGSITLSFLMLASSSSPNKSKAIEKEHIRLSNDHSQNNRNPLAGVNIDIDHFNQIFSKLFRESKQDQQSFEKIYLHEVIQSTQYKFKLLSRGRIFQKIVSWARGQRTVHHFLFTGHGYYEGAMCIQTLQNPDGQPFTIEELVDIWIQNKPGGERRLTIFLDCCYSGKMACRLRKVELPEGVIKVQIYCSSGPSQISLDVNLYGGLLICALWDQATNNQYLMPVERNQLKKIFQQKLPVYAEYGPQGWSQLRSLDWHFLQCK